MANVRGVGIVAIIGSGETSPTMVTVHRGLIARLPADRRAGVVLATPYGFQNNADDVSAKARGYFTRSVGFEVSVLAASGDERELAALRAADWAFAGPGSPSYALRHWRGGPVAQALHDRIRLGHGVTVLASAAAAAIGRFALPVYEIYKAGEPPHWLDGLDLLSVLGLRVAVIPHFDNTEGGTYDTRFCYLGEKRLTLLERELPDDIAVLGVDEHTAAIVDLPAGTVEVSGRGGVTVRRKGFEAVLPTGTTVTIAELAALTRGDRGVLPAQPAQPGQPADRSGPAAEPAQDGRAAGRTATLREIVTECEQRFEAAGSAESGGSAAGMVDAILDLEAAIHEWGGDTEEDDGVEQARAVLRTLVVRLGDAATAGLTDPRDQLTPVVDRLIELREQLRTQHAYPAADAIRDALVAGGLQVHDAAASTTWSWNTPHRPPP